MSKKQILQDSVWRFQDFHDATIEARKAACLQFGIMYIEFAEVYIRVICVVSVFDHRLLQA